jgi:hypothetical protein
MFVLQSMMHRNGAFCREFFQPAVTSPIPGVVFGSLTVGGAGDAAKQYPSYAEALADIPNWVEITRKFDESRGYAFAQEEFMRTITVKEL